MSGSALIGALRVMLGLESAGFTEGLTAAQVRLKAFDARVKGIGAGMAKAGAAISVVGAGVAAAVREQINSMDAMDEMSQRVGVPVEAMSGLKYAAEQSGVGVDLLETSLTMLSKKMDDAASGGGSAKVFDELGISVTDAGGKMRATEDVLADVSDALAKMPPGAGRTAAAMKLLGKSGAGMLPMLQDGSAGLQAMTEEAAAMGLVISSDAAAAAGKFNENLDKLPAQLKGVAMIVAANLVPMLERLSTWLTDAAKAFQNLSPATQSWMTAIAAGTVIMGPALVAIGAVVGSLGKLAMAFRALGLAVMSNPIMAAIAVIAGGAYLIYQNWDWLSEWFGAVWQGIKDACSAAWQGVKNAWNGAVEWFRKLGSDISAAATEKWNAMVGDMTAIWDQIKGGAAAAWDTVKSTITGALDAAVAKVTDLIRVFTDAWEKVKGIGQAIADAFTGADDLDTRLEKDRQKWIDLGRNTSTGYVLGIGQGMEVNRGEIRRYLGIPAEIARDELQIRSPSRVFAQIGRFLMEGLGVGIEQGAGGVVTSMTEAGQGVIAAGKTAFGSGSVFGGVTDSVDRLGSASDGVFDRMGRWMVDLSKGATSLADTLRRLASSWSSSIGQSVMTDVSGVLTGSFGKAGGGLLSGIVGGLLGFANGGQFQVGGVGGIDSQVVAFRASPNETVSISKPGQGFAMPSGIAMSASELTLSDDGRIMAVVRAEMMQSARAAAGAGAALARADFPDIRRRAKDRF